MSPHAYQIEIRTNIEAPETEIRAHAQALANRTGGEVTAIFDLENGYEELDL